ncbi:DMT family transporter [Oleomonas cavernae]|uniref:DMT family transporter n=2 Tax=Oleomonas cavernae TaxID=2320859 RepID=A0A418WJG0_9PROT|nr:DMT family transporter [Oleomonas cavernae]
MGPAEWAMLLLLSVLWGGSFFFIGIAVTGLPPFTIVLLRVALAAVVLNLAMPLMGLRMPRDGKSWAAFFGMGLLNNAIPFCLIVWGQTQIASGLASILNAMTPVATVVVAHFLTTDEKMTGNRLAGVLIGLAGVVCMIGPGVLSGLGDKVWAQAAVLGATVSYAFAGIFGRRFKAMGISPLATATGQVTASSVLLAPVVLLVDQPWTLAMPGLDVWAAVVGLALLSTTFAYILFFRIMASAGATNLSLVTFLIPVSAILLGTFVLHETLAPKHFLGMALIGAGLAAIDGRLFRRR